MAELDPFDALFAKPPEESDDIGASDYGKAVVSGAYGTASTLAGAAQYVTGGDEESIPAAARQWADEGQKDWQESMSPAARRAMGASFLPTEGEGNDLYDENVSSGHAIGLKVAGAVPSLVASLIPGSLAVRLGAGAVGAAAVGGVAAGAQTGGDLANDIRRGILEASPEELQKSDVYRGLIDMGYDDTAAREHMIAEAQGYLPIIMGGITALTSTQGVEGMVAGVTKGGIRQGIVKEAAQEGVENASQSLLTDKGNMDVGMQDDIRWRRALEQTVEGMAVGGIMGGAVGAVTGEHHVDNNPHVEVPDEHGVGKSEQAALSGAAIEAPLPPQAEIAAQQAAPAPAQAVPTDPLDDEGDGIEEEPPAGSQAAVDAAQSTANQALDTATIAVGQIDPAIEAAIAAQPETPNAPAPAQPDAPLPGAAPDSAGAGGLPAGGPDVAPADGAGAAGIPLDGAAGPVGPATAQVPQRTLAEPTAPLSPAPAEQTIPQVEEPVTPEGNGPLPLQETGAPSAKVEAPTPELGQVPPVVEPAPKKKKGSAKVAEVKAQKLAEQAARNDAAKAEVEARDSRIQAIRDEMHQIYREREDVVDAGRAGAKKADTVRSIAQSADRIKELRDELAGLTNRAQADKAAQEARDAAAQARKQVLDAPVAPTHSTVTPTGKVLEDEAQKKRARKGPRMTKAKQEQVARGETEVVSKEEDEKRQKDRHKTAIVDRVRQFLKDNVYNPADLSTPKAQRDYMGRLLAHAEVGDLKLARLEEDDPTELKHLAQAKKLQKAGTIKDLVDFMVNDMDLREGGDLAASYRKSQAAKSEQTYDESQGDAEGKSSSSLTGSGSGVNEEEDSLLDAIDAKRHEETQAEVNKAAVSEDAVTVGQNKEGTFKVVKGRPKLDIKPKVAGKVELKPRAKVLASRAKAELDEMMDADVRSEVEGLDAKIDAALDALPFRQREALERNLLADGMTVYEVVRAYLGKINERLEAGAVHLTELGNTEQIVGRIVRYYSGHHDTVEDSTLRGMLDRYDMRAGAVGSRATFLAPLKRRLMELVGAIPVRVVSYDTFIDMELHGLVFGGHEAPSFGWYDPNTNEIILREDRLQDPVRAAQLIVHEGIHAAFARAIKTNAVLRKLLERLHAEALAWTKENMPGEVKRYGFTNIDEFMTEAFTNDQFQTLLSELPISDALAKEIGLQPRPGVFKSIWQGMIEKVRQVIGLPPGEYSALEGIIKLTGRFDSFVTMYGVRPQGIAGIYGSRATQSGNALASRGPAVVYEAQTALRDHFHGDNNLRRFGLMVSTLDQIRQWGRGLFVDSKGQDLLEHFVGELQKVGPETARLRETGQDLARRFAEFAKGKAQEAVRLADLAIEATMLDVNPEAGGDNTHLHQARNAQALNKLPGLQARWAALSPEGKQLWRDMAGHFRAVQNEIHTLNVEAALDIDSSLSLAPADRQAVVQAALNDTLDDTHRKLIGNDAVFNALQKSAPFKLSKGVYFPLMRHGNYVVRTEDKVAVTHGGNEVEPGVVEFRGARDDAHKRMTAFQEGSDLVVQGVAKTFYLKGTDTRVTSDQALKANPNVKPVKTPIYFDLKTGKRLSKDDALQPGSVEGVDYRVGERTSYVDQNGNRISKDDAISQVADHAYRVRVQKQGTYFFDTKAEANRFIRENKARGATVDDSPLDKKWLGTRTDLGNAHLNTLMASVNARQDLKETEKGMLRAALYQAAAMSMSGNRVEHRAIERRNVKGASNDFARNLVQYAEASARYRAKMKIMPTARETFREMGKLVGAIGDKQAAARGQFLNELANRVDTNILTENEPSAVTKNLMALSFFDKLASPAYSVMNAMQPWMVTYPVLAGRYGGVRATLALSKAYRRIGALNATLEGLTNTGKALRLDKITLNTDDIVGDILSRFKGRERAMFQALVDRGAIANDAGFEIAAEFSKGAGKFGTGVSRFDRVARQLPAAIEAINRSVTALAAYELATQRGKSHEDAVAEAFDAVQNTQGDYSNQNAPRFMNAPALRWAMQFKKYAQMMTALLAQMTYKAFKGASPQERWEARRQFAHLVAVQMLAAGALSLPGLEIVKAAVLLAGAMGLGDGWDDEEKRWRDLMKDAVGDSWEEKINKGILSRAIGIDISSRVSLADLWLFGEPKTNDRDGTVGYIGQQVLGAPGSLALDWLDAVHHGADGEWQKAAAKVLPVKVIADFVGSVGKEDAGTTAVNTFGFKTAAQAERGAALGAKKRANEKRDTTEKDLVRRYLAATSKGELIKIKAQIAEYNKQPGINFKSKIYTKGLDKIRAQRGAE